MRKLSLIFMLMVFILSGCFNTVNEDSDEYRALSSQFDSFVSHDIIDVDQFEAFVNKATFESIMSNVMIKVLIYDSFHKIAEVRYGSGVIFAVGAYNYVMTTFDLTNNPLNDMVSYQVTDYQGRTSNAIIDVVSEEYELAVLRFVRVLSNRLPAVDFASQDSLIGEPVMLFGYIGEVMNSMSMGLVEDSNPNDVTLDRYMHTSIPSDLNANGSAIININNELLGIQIGIQDGFSYAVSISDILNFLKIYSDYHKLD